MFRRYYSIWITSEKNLYEAILGKKEKLNVLKKVLSYNDGLVHKLNTAMDDAESNTVVYYEPYEVKPLRKNSEKHLSFFQLNIFSLPFHTEELSTLITEHLNLNLDFLGIT